MNILDQIRTACATVAAQATHVAIIEDRIPIYAQQLRAERTSVEPAQLLDQTARENAAAYWLTLDTVNFGSGWFPTLLKLQGMTGYRTIKAGVDRRFRDDGPWSARQLQRITMAEISTLMGQEPDHPLMPLFKASLRDLGAHVEQEFGGEFAGLVDACEPSAARAVELLSSWECFADSSAYRGGKVPFLKRAQIAVADLSRAGTAAWRDLDRLTLFADNLVPHVLRLDGILSFEAGLLARIDAEELIEHGSEEEVEIRACAVHAIELISRACGQTPERLDEILWNRGQGTDYKSVPRHRSRSTAY